MQPSIARRLCYEAGPTIEWLNDRGVAILDVISSGEEDRPRGHTTEGGAAIVAALAGRVGAFKGVDVALNSRGGPVAGGKWQSYRRRAGCRHCHGCYRGDRHGRFCSQSRIGDAMVSARNESGLLAYCITKARRGRREMHCASPLRWGRKSREGGVRVHPYGLSGGGYLPTFTIVVNQLGRRFYTETASYSASEIAISRQPSALSHIIFDQAARRTMKTTKDVLRFTKMILPETEHLLATWTDAAIDDHVVRGDMLRADSLADLAVRIGVPPGESRRHDRALITSMSSTELMMRTI